MFTLSVVFSVTLELVVELEEKYVYIYTKEPGTM